MKSDRIIAWLTFAIVAALLFGGLWWVQQMQKPAAPAITVASTTGGSIIVEPIALTGIASGGGELYGFVTTTNFFQGELLEIYIDYTDGISTETDITVTHLGLVNYNVLVSADTATDAVWRPRVLPNFYNTYAITPTNAVPYYLSGRFAINIAQTNSATPGTVYIKYRR